MAGASSTIWRSTAAQAGPAPAGSVACRRSARWILPSSWRLQNSEVLRLSALLGTNDRHLSPTVRSEGDGAPCDQYAAIWALFLESFTKTQNFSKSAMVLSR